MDARCLCHEVLPGWENVVFVLAKCVKKHEGGTQQLRHKGQSNWAKNKNKFRKGGTLGTAQHRGAGQSPSLEVLRIQLEKALSNPVCLGQQGLEPLRSSPDQVTPAPHSEEQRDPTVGSGWLVLRLQVQQEQARGRAVPWPQFLFTNSTAPRGLQLCSSQLEKPTSASDREWSWRPQHLWLKPPPDLNTNLSPARRNPSKAKLQGSLLPPAEHAPGKKE